MNRIYLLIALFILAQCTRKEDAVGRNAKSFVVQGVNSAYDISFDFPQTFISVREIASLDRIDTTDAWTAWILEKQYENPEGYYFFDSTDTRLNVFIKAGSRVDISDKERSTTYFKVPTIRLEQIFPAESDNRRIVNDSGEQKFQDKTFYKRRYRLIPDSLGFQDFYYLSTKYQSTFVVVNCPEKVSLDRIVLGYELKPKPRSNR